MASQKCYEIWDKLFRGMKRYMLENSIHKWVFNGTIQTECMICGRSLADWYEEMEEEMEKWEEPKNEVLSKGFEEGDYFSKNG